MSADKGNGGFSPTGVVSAAQRGVDARRAADARKEYHEFLADYSKRLKVIQGSAEYSSAKRIGDILMRMETLSKKVSNPDFHITAAQLDTAKSCLNDAAEGLKEACSKRKNVLKQVKDLRASKNSSPYADIFGEDASYGMLNPAAAEQAQDAARNRYQVRRLDNNVLGRSRGGKVTDEAVTSVENFDGEAYYRNSSYTSRKVLEAAARRTNGEVAKNIAEIESVIETGKGLTREQRESHDVDVSSMNPSLPGTSAVLDSLSSSVGKFARHVMKESRPEDSKRLTKYFEQRDKAMEKLLRELKKGGIGSQIMDLMRGQLADNGFLDPVTFAQLLKEINEQKKKDGEGISDGIIAKFNETTKKAIAEAEKDNDNNDSRFFIRAVQFVLITTAFVGLPFLGPLAGTLTNAIFGAQGFAQGTASLMTADELWLVGDLAGLMEMDTVAAFLLTETPVINSAVGLIDYTLSNGFGRFFGSSVINASQFPLVPGAAAAYAFFYAQSNNTYYDKDAAVKKHFKEFAEELDEIVMANIGADTTKNAGGDLANDGLRAKFVEEKFRLIGLGNKIAASGVFLADLYDHLGGERLGEIFSPQLLEFLQGNGLEPGQGALNEEVVVKAVAELMHGVDRGAGKEALAKEFTDKFGLYNFACVSSAGAEVGAVVGDFANMVAENASHANDEKCDKNIVAKYSKYSEIGNDAFEASNVFAGAKNNAIEFDEAVVAGFAGKSHDEKIALGEKMKAESDRVKSQLVAKESGRIKEAIDTRTPDTDSLAVHNAAPSGTPGNSPEVGGALALGALRGRGVRA